MKVNSEKINTTTMIKIDCHKLTFARFPRSQKMTFFTDSFDKVTMIKIEAEKKAPIIIPLNNIVFISIKPLLLPSK